MCICVYSVTHYNIFTIPQTWKLFYFPKQRNFQTTLHYRRVYIINTHTLNNVLSPIFFFFLPNERCNIITPC